MEYAIDGSLSETETKTPCQKTTDEIINHLPVWSREELTEFTYLIEKFTKQCLYKYVGRNANGQTEKDIKAVFPFISDIIMIGSNAHVMLDRDFFREKNIEVKKEGFHNGLDLYVKPEDELITDDSEELVMKEVPKKKTMYEVFYVKNGKKNVVQVFHKFHNMYEFLCYIDAKYPNRTYYGKKVELKIYEDVL